MEDLGCFMGGTCLSTPSHYSNTAFSPICPIGILGFNCIDISKPLVSSNLLN